MERRSFPHNCLSPSPTFVSHSCQVQIYARDWHQRGSAAHSDSGTQATDALSPATVASKVILGILPQPDGKEQGKGGAP